MAGRRYQLERIETLGSILMCALILSGCASRSAYEGVMGLIQESGWTDGGHRLYDESVFQRLSKIIELRKTKTLSQIRRIMQTSDSVAETGGNAVAS